MSRIALNFFALETDEFTFKLHCMPYVEEERPVSEDGEEAIRRYLNINGTESHYWTLLQPIHDSTEVVLKPFDNVYATLEALRLALIQSCKKNLDSTGFQIIGGFRRRVEVITDKFTEGMQVMSLEPYLLRSRNKFGFTADFRFHPVEEHRLTRRARELSLSHDKNDRPNLNYYSDRYSRLTDFVDRFHSKIFPLVMPDDQKVAVLPNLIELTHKTLDAKQYIVGSDRKSKSQFMGVKQHGPMKEISKDAKLYFIYREEEHALSQDLFRALRGDMFHTFPGMGSMFRFPISNENVRGIPLQNFDIDAIQQVRDQIIIDAGDCNVVPIVLTPFSRRDESEENYAYWTLKHAFLSNGLPIQVVASQTVADRNTLKWSTAGIGLQIFAKIGGTPWKVLPRIENCLIVGIGQAHRKVEGHIERFFAYSVLTDSSGILEEVRVLGDTQNEDDYIETFSDSLRGIFKEYSSKFSSFVVHSTFSIRKRELEEIASALEGQQDIQAQTGEFVSLKFNDIDHFFGFSTKHNNRVPYESSVVSLSHNEYLVWFEGLQYGKSVVHKPIPRPLHVKFTYPTMRLSAEQQRMYLQGAIDLSGANWRGFNAKALPVSIYYAQLIAKYLREFDKYQLPQVKIDVIKPWFL